MSKTPNLPTPQGRELGEALASFVDVEIAALESAGNPVPVRCAECAFRRGTVPNGCVPTLMDAVKTLFEGEIGFDCHLPGREGVPCGGYQILAQADAGGDRVSAPWQYSDESAKEPTP